MPSYGLKNVKLPRDLQNQFAKIQDYKIANCKIANYKTANYKMLWPVFSQSFKKAARPLSVKA